MITVRNILISKFKHIGDVLLMTPLLAVIKEFFPETKLLVAVNKGTEELLLHNKNIDKLLVFDRQVKKRNLKKKIKGEMDFVKSIRREKIDLSIDLSGGDRGAILSFLSGAKIRLGYTKGRKGMFFRNLLFTHLSASNNTKKHMIQHNLDILREIDITSQKKEMEIFLTKKEDEKIKKLFLSLGIQKDDLVITIHPTSRWLFKCWKDEYLAEICDYLTAKYQARVILTSANSSKELDKVSEIVSLLKHNKIINLSGKTTIRELAGIIKRSDLFIGIDSAPMHIASALKVPSIILFGPSGHHNWGPLNKEAAVICKEELSCMPCGKDGCNGSKKSKCLEMITPGELCQAIDKKLAYIPHK